MVPSIIQLLFWCAMFNYSFGTVLKPQSCRPSLPSDWFISQFQELPTFSENLTQFAKAAYFNLTSFINYTVGTVGGVDAVSVVVAGPWGVVAEHNVGKLRANDSADETIVNGNSIYRIASISKVVCYFLRRKRRVEPLGAYDAGNSCFRSKRQIVVG